MRIFFTDTNPDDLTSRKFTRLEPIMRSDEIAEVAKAAASPSGVIALYVEPQHLGLGMDIETHYAKERATKRAAMVEAGADPDRVDFADRAGTDVLPVQTVEMPGYLELFGRNFPAPGSVTAAQAIMPEFTFNLPMDGDGKLFNHHNHYIERWAYPTPPDHEADGHESLKITVRFEYRVLGWHLGWPED